VVALLGWAQLGPELRPVHSSELGWHPEAPRYS
jgi:hypothetical protein